MSAQENAIEKHAECAAAITSSELVTPFASALRAGQETGKTPTPEELSVTSPLPSKSVPF